MAKVTVYTTDYCPFCDAAKGFLQEKGITFTEIDVTDPEKKMELKKKTGWMTVPQIFIDEELIGGYMELVALDRHGGLADKLN